MESRQFNVVFCRRWLLTSVSQASTTTARVSVDIVSTVCDLTALQRTPPQSSQHVNSMGPGAPSV